jgi:hypothetical protein
MPTSVKSKNFKIQAKHGKTGKIVRGTQYIAHFIPN